MFFERCIAVVDLLFAINAPIVHMYLCREWVLNFCCFLLSLPKYRSILLQYVPCVEDTVLGIVVDSKFDVSIMQNLHLFPYAEFIVFMRGNVKNLLVLDEYSK